MFQLNITLASPERRQIEDAGAHEFFGPILIFRYKQERSGQKLQGGCVGDEKGIEISAGDEGFGLRSIQIVLQIVHK